MTPGGLPCCVSTVNFSSVFLRAFDRGELKTDSAHIIWMFFLLLARLNEDNVSKSHGKATSSRPSLKSLVSLTSLVGVLPAAPQFH